MASMRRAPSRRFQLVRPVGLRRAILGAAALAATCAGGDASAQFAYGYARVYPGYAYEDDLPPIPPRAVVYRLQDRGFTEIARPRFDGRAYVVDATSPAGGRVRLFVDAREGGVIGRQRLDAPSYPPGRIARAAPGYGWTEEDAAPRRAGRDPEGLLPPADIPLPRPSLHSEIDRAPAVPYRPGAPGPFGVNPDAGARGEPGRGDKARPAAPHKTAKLTPPAKPPAPRAAPEAPAARIAPVEPAATPAPDAASKADPAKIEPAKIEPAKADPVTPEPARSEAARGEPLKLNLPKRDAAKADPAPVTPSAQEPAAADKPAEAARVAETAPAGKAAPVWQDPPEGKRNVRVIGGATVVPGGGGTETAPSGGAN